MPDPITAILASATLVTSGAVASAVTAAADTSADLGPWVQGGSAVLAVGALGYIARMLADGRLVARDTAAEIALLKTMLDDSRRREDRLHELLGHQIGDGR